MSAFNFFTGLAGGKEFWIGLDDKANEGSFVWATGENVGYSNWNSGKYLMLKSFCTV